MQIHKMRHVIDELAAYIPEADQSRPAVKELLDWGCPTRMHVVRMLAPSLANETQTKDVDFSAAGIHARWQAGYEHCGQAVARAPWRDEFDPLEGVMLHEPPHASIAEPAPVVRRPDRSASREAVPSAVTSKSQRM